VEWGGGLEVYATNQHGFRPESAKIEVQTVKTTTTSPVDLQQQNVQILRSCVRSAGI